MTYILTVKDLKKQLADIPDDWNVCLCVEDFPYAHFWGSVSVEPSHEKDGVGVVLLGLNPETDFANYLKGA
jgi:hypothetical protein